MELDKYCTSKEAPDSVKSQYLFFVANVVAKSPIKGIDTAFYYHIARELLV
jgi:hypothetical protein